MPHKFHKVSILYLHSFPGICGTHPCAILDVLVVSCTHAFFQTFKIQDTFTEW